jgi:hypothetical protein
VLKFLYIFPNRFNKALPGDMIEVSHFETGNPGAVAGKYDFFQITGGKRKRGQPGRVFFAPRKEEV